MKKIYLLFLFSTNLFSFTTLKELDINPDNLFALAPQTSIYSLLVNPEKFENKLITFSGFWVGVPWDADGMIYPNKDLANFNDKFSGINIYLKKQVSTNLSMDCNNEYFAVQGKVKKSRDVYIVVDAVIRRVPGSKKNSNCTLGRA